MMKVLKDGQGVRHTLFGVGVTTRSSEARTTIDFYEHGSKTFVTELLQVELLDEAPPRPGRARAKVRKS